MKLGVKREEAIKNLEERKSLENPMSQQDLEKYREVFRLFLCGKGGDCCSSLMKVDQAEMTLIFISENLRL